MGKAKAAKRNGASTNSSPYERPAKQQKSKNNIFGFTKSHGQHILRNPGVADAIVQKANLKPTDTVLEVGPGSGNLTVRIVEKCKKLIACEIDPRMAAEVTKRLQGKPEAKRLEVLLGDVIKMDQLPPCDVCKLTPSPIFPCPTFLGRSGCHKGQSLTPDVRHIKHPLSSYWQCQILHEHRCSRICTQLGDDNPCDESWQEQLQPTPESEFLTVHPLLRLLDIYMVIRESSVVRIEPKRGTDRPNVSFQEWDGMLRVCFNRRNKTLRSSWLGTKEVLSLVERNYRLWCSMNNIPLEEGTVDDEDDAGDDDMEVDENKTSGLGDDEEEWGGIMDVDGSGDVTNETPSYFDELKAAGSEVPKTKSKRKKTKVAVLVKEKLRHVLEDVTGLADQRAGKCDENDFLRLLSALNAEGIHLS